jgi:hypothetical protein
MRARNPWSVSLFRLLGFLYVGCIFDLAAARAAASYHVEDSRKD